MYKNLARVLEVHMDSDYKLFFYLMIPILRRTMFEDLKDFENLIKSKNFKAINSILNNSTLINEVYYFNIFFLFFHYLLIKQKKK